MTRFGGHLDDMGVELLNQSIQGLSKPRVEPDGKHDKRSAATRQGQARGGWEGSIEVLRLFLDHGDAPTHGGERPHVTVTMRYDDLMRRIEGAYLSYGGPVSAAEARRIACDADIIPAVLGTGSEVLDVGGRTGCSPPRSGKPSLCGIKAARGRGVTGRSPGARAIMSHIGCITAKLPTPTGFSSAFSITPRSIKGIGRSNSPPMVSPNSFHQRGLIRIRNRAGTPPTTSPPCSGGEVVGKRQRSLLDLGIWSHTTKDPSLLTARVTPAEPAIMMRLFALPAGGHATRPSHCQ